MHSDRDQAKAKPMLPAISILRNPQNVQTTQDGQNRGSVSTKSVQMQEQRYKFLSPTEWAVVARGLGGIKDGESMEPARPRSGPWPSRGMPPGLYKDVVIQRAKCFYLFHVSSIFRWTLLVLQIVLGATLTALGPSSTSKSVPITILGAANTIVAGLLALFHNSGFPDRFRYDMREFERVEDHIRGILEARLAPADEDLDQVLANCFDLFSSAKSTVAANMPPSYKRLEPEKRASKQPGGSGPLQSGSSQEVPANAPNGEKSFMT